MSMPDETTITCPGCGNEQTFEIWKSVNVSLDADLKQKVLSGELMDFCCDKCGEKNRVVYPFLYHDMDQALMIWLLPGDTPPDDASGAWSEIVKTLPRNAKRRWVKSYNELIEKIYIFDAGIDDRGIECFKSILRDKWADHVADEDEFLFCGRTEKENQIGLRFGVLSESGYRKGTAAIETFNRLIEAIGDDLDSIFPLDAAWPRVHHRDLLESEDESSREFV